MKRDTSIARNIWKSYHGDIPKDLLGRSYEIHHKDRNPHNNELLNLDCISVEDHYIEHYTQGEFAACKLIAKRLSIISRLISHKIIWVNNGKKEMLVDENILDEYKKIGYIKGMLSTKGEKNPMHRCHNRTPPALGKKWITNNINDLLIKYDEVETYIKCGWKYGRSKIKGDNNKKTFIGRTSNLHPRSISIDRIDMKTLNIIERITGIREVARLYKVSPSSIITACDSFENYVNKKIESPKAIKGHFWKRSS